MEKDLVKGRQFQTFDLLCKKHSMKRFFFSAILVAPTFLMAQQKISFWDKTTSKRITNNAMEQYASGQSSNAYMLLKQAVALNPENANAFYWLANTEFDLRSFHYAEEHLQQALVLLGDKKTTEHLFLAGQIAQTLGKSKEANAFYSECSKTLKEKDAEELGLSVLIAQCEFALAEAQKGVLLQRQLLGANLNTKYDEYGPILRTDGRSFYFTARNPDTKGANINPDDQRFFEDIFMAHYDAENQNFVLDFSQNDLLNTEGFDALSYLSPDEKTALGTLNTSASKELSTQSSDIFELSTETPGAWDDKQVIRSIPGLNTSFFEGAASKSDTVWLDEYTYVEEIYFVSDRRAEKYATDIFVVRKTNGVWGSEAEALPLGINTTGRETTPYVTPDGKWLFFSSDALPGMGGYDVFVCKREGKTWSAPTNLGATVNTSNDDTHFQYNPSTQKATMAGVSELDGLFSYNLFFIDFKTIEAAFK
jgi:hypothetical protein